MPKVIKVTSVHVAAAKLKIKLAAKTGTPVSPAVYAIANATRPKKPEGPQDDDA